MKILLAEDDQNISIIAHMTLAELGGHDVTVVNDGQAALDAALENKYDLILLDEMMPKINGLRVSEMYRQQRSGKQAPIIFLSAKSQESDIEKFLSNGKGHILKPFDPATLCQTIVKIMEEAS